jgi:hypothetical protein
MMLRSCVRQVQQIGHSGERVPVDSDQKGHPFVRSKTAIPSSRQSGARNGYYTRSLMLMRFIFRHRRLAELKMTPRNSYVVFGPSHMICQPGGLVVA